MGTDQLTARGANLAVVPAVAAFPRPRLTESKSRSHHELSRRGSHQVARRRALRSRTARRRARLLRTIILASVLLVLGLRAGRIGVGPLAHTDSTSSGSMTPAATRTYEVQPGDTDWSIAAGYVKGHDIRPYVDAIAEQHEGRQLQIGETIQLP